MDFTEGELAALYRAIAAALAKRLGGSVRITEDEQSFRCQTLMRRDPSDGAIEFVVIPEGSPKGSA